MLPLSHIIMLGVKLFALDWLENIIQNNTKVQMVDNFDIQELLKVICEAGTS